MIPQHILDRKGPRSFKELNPEVIEYLNAGKIETKNLMEWLSADQLVLLKIVLTELKKEDWFSMFDVAINAQKKPTANSNTRVIGEIFAEMTSDAKIYSKLKSHQSDIVRCWACWGESLQYDDLNELLSAMKSYAADTHFGVREVVIFATKDRMIGDLGKAISILTRWTSNADENIRRFAIEALRPLGVWVKKIAKFQEQPELGLPLIEPLKADTSKYVRDSVGNWLNDASKSQPDFVVATCKRWKQVSDTKETTYIIKKALRTIEKLKKY